MGAVMNKFGGKTGKSGNKILELNYAEMAAFGNI